ncbi:MAG: DUF6573 family protein [Fibrobacterota bacterium]
MFQDLDVISTYTRAQAIADGVLVDASATAREAGIRYPVAVTSTVWDSYIVPDAALSPWGNSADGRLWDVLIMFRYAATHQQDATLLFSTIFTMARKDGAGCFQKEVQLKAICGPGDTADPVITIMLPNED